MSARILVMLSAILFIPYHVRIPLRIPVSDLDDTIMVSKTLREGIKAGQVQFDPSTTFEFATSTNVLHTTPRPGLAKHLLSLSKLFVIHVLTAGTREYANVATTFLREFLA